MNTTSDAVLPGVSSPFSARQNDNAPLLAACIEAEWHNSRQSWLGTTSSRHTGKSQLGPRWSSALTWESDLGPLLPARLDIDLKDLLNSHIGPTQAQAASVQCHEGCQGYHPWSDPLGIISTTASLSDPCARVCAYVCTCVQRCMTVYM
jgi:hypothetical protein